MAGIEEWDPNEAKNLLSAIVNYLITLSATSTALHLCETCMMMYPYTQDGEATATELLVKVQDALGNETPDGFEKARFALHCEKLINAITFLLHAINGKQETGKALKEVLMSILNPSTDQIGNYTNGTVIRAISRYIANLSVSEG